MCRTPSGWIRLRCRCLQRRTSHCAHIAFQRFVERHYRAEWNDAWRQAFQLIYDAAPSFGERAESGLGLRMPVPWSTDAELKASLQSKTQPPSNPFSRILELLKTLAPSVRTNEGDFRAFVLAVEYLDGVFWRESAIREHASAKSPTQAESAALIDEIAGRDRKLAVALSADWDTGRFPDAPAKTAPLYGISLKTSWSSSSIERPRIQLPWRGVQHASSSFGNRLALALALIRHSGVPGRIFT